MPAHARRLEFEALNETLVGYLAEVTARIFLARLHRAEQGIAARLLL